MGKSAVLWIRDGVLMDRMPINAVAFAFAAWRFSVPEKRKTTSIPRLINFAFEKSGVSCAEKLQLYQSEVEPVDTDIEGAVHCYNALATAAASHAWFFTGALDLLRELQNAGVYNFITSAVEQPVLDQWMDSEQGKLVAPYLTEVLGSRADFSKGRDHFQYVSQKFGVTNIFYVADAVAEIKTGKAFAGEFNIHPIGYANEITERSLLEALAVVQALNGLEAPGATSTFPDIEMETVVKAISVPGPLALQTALYEAGACKVITGSADTLMANLKAYLFERIS